MRKRVRGLALRRIASFFVFRRVVYAPDIINSSDVRIGTIRRYIHFFSSLRGELLEVILLRYNRRETGLYQMFRRQNNRHFGREC